MDRNENAENSGYQNDFCRIWARSGLLPSLARALDSFNADNTLPGDYPSKISEILLIFSKSDEIVKQLFCTQEVLVPLFSALVKLSKKPLLDILKAIKDIALESRTLGALQKARAIPVFVSLLSSKEITDTHTQYVLQTLFSLCRLVAARQEEAAKEGIVPHLKECIEADSTSKQFALPIILEFARGKKTLPVLWENNCVEFYTSLFTQGYPWQVQAVDALASWMAAEPDRVSSVLIQDKQLQALMKIFLRTEGEAFSALAESFHKLVQNALVGQSLIEAGFTGLLLTRISDRLRPTNHSSNNTLILVNLVKVLTALFKVSQDRKQLIERYSLMQLVERLEKDKAVLVAEMAGQLKMAMQDGVW